MPALLKALVCHGLLLALVALCSATLDNVWTLKRDEGGRWWFLNPKGERFWSLGVCCVNPGTKKEEWNPKNRSYASFRLFGSDQDWVNRIQTELPSLGFNSIGGWSEVDLFGKLGGKDRLPYFVVLHLGAYNGVPWNDIFDEKSETAIEQAAKDQIPKLAGDPYLMGYFTDNELGWWDDTLFVNYLGMPEGSPGRKRIIKEISRFYRNDFQRLKRDWNVAVESFDKLQKNPVMTLKPGSRGIDLVHRWTGVLAERYYKLVHDAVRRHDLKRLILGDRYIQFYTFDTARAASKYVDAVSTNNGADWNDGTYVRYFLDSLHKLTRKPVIVTEFYACAMQNRSGNKNSGDWFPKVETQAERAVVFRNCVEHFAGRPYVVGAHWFQYYDEPEHGRSDGEDWNMGLVDIEGRPYEELASAAKAVDAMRLHEGSGSFPVCDLVPKLPKYSAKGLRDWDRRNGFVTPSEGVAHGDLYLAQDNESVYFGLYATDYMDETLYQGWRAPEAERELFRITIEGGPGFKVRFGGKERPATFEPANLQVSEVEGLRHTVIVRVEKAALKDTSGRLRLRGEAFTHSRGNRMAWKAEVRLR